MHSIECMCRHFLPERRKLSGRRRHFRSKKIHFFFERSKGEYKTIKKKAKRKLLFAFKKGCLNVLELSNDIHQTTLTISFSY
jgi:hypothetical protein